MRVPFSIHVLKLCIGAIIVPLIHVIKATNTGEVVLKIGSVGHGIPLRVVGIAHD